MTAGNDQRRTAELAKEIAYLQSIATEDEFRRYVEDTFRDRDPDPITVEALRSRELVARTYRALGVSVDLINDDIKTNDRRPPGDPQKRRPDWERSARRMQQVFGAERRNIQPLALDVMDEQGWRPGKPNPRRRAEHRIWQLTRKRRTITPELADAILAEEQGKAEAHLKREAARRRQERAARRAAARKQQPPRESVPKQRPQS